MRVSRLHLDAASYRQLVGAAGGDLNRLRTEVLSIVEQRGKMHNPVTGSGGVLLGVVDDVGPASELGLRVGDRIATLVSLTATPLILTDRLERWAGTSPQVPTSGHAILFARSIAVAVPEDLGEDLAIALFDVCGAAALTRQVVQEARARTGRVSVCVLGASGRAGSLALAAARDAGAEEVVGVVPTCEEATSLDGSGLADLVVTADCREPLTLLAAVPGTADVTIVCVDVPGCEAAAILATADGGTVVFFSMSTAFQSAALTAEALVRDVRMLIGSGYVRGHVGYALRLVRHNQALRGHLEHRVAAEVGSG